MAQLVKNPPAMRETWVQSLGWEDPLEKGKATHSSILAQKSPWGRKESDMTERLNTCTPPIDNRDQELWLYVFATFQVTLYPEVPKAHHH